MKTFRIKIKDEGVYKLEADTEDKAKFQVEEWFHERIHPMEIEEMCPHCNVALKAKMHDVDGTNLVESMTCEECKYGTPALM